MRRALLLLAIVLLVVVAPPSARAATTHTIEITSGEPDPKTAQLVVGDKVKWKNNDAESHTIKAEGNDVATIAPGATSAEFSFDEGQYDYTVTGIAFTGDGSIVVTAPPTTSSSTTTSTSTTTTTTKPTNTSSGSSTTTSSSTTTTTSSSTTSTTTTTTRPTSSASGQVAIKDKGDSGGGSSALPLLLGAFVVVAGLAGLAYWLWRRSGVYYEDEYEDEGPDWTDEPPTVQGPRY